MVDASDERPPLWVGHVLMRSHELEKSHAFMLRLGLRPIDKGDDYAILELRGGTHLAIFRGEEPNSGVADFDFMVEDLDATHARFSEMGLSPSPIETGRIHRSFTVRDPSGLEIPFNSSHVSDLPV